MWWPSPKALNDLVVDDVEGGFTLSAPDGSECAAWLHYWNETPERQEFFSEEFQKVLLDHLNNLEHGKTESEPNKQDSD